MVEESSSALTEPTAATNMQEVDQDQENAQVSRNIASTLPAAILSTIALFLPNSDKMKLSLGSLYFNSAMQWHFRLLINQDYAAVMRLPIEANTAPVF